MYGISTSGTLLHGDSGPSVPAAGHRAICEKTCVCGGAAFALEGPSRRLDARFDSGAASPNEKGERPIEVERLDEAPRGPPTPGAPGCG